MNNTRPGWYPDPRDSRILRWWNGVGWTNDIRTNAPALPGGDAMPARGTRSTTRIWLWAALGILAVVVVLILPRLAIVVGIVTLITSIVGLVSGKRTWFRFRSRMRAATVTTVSVLALVLAGGVVAAAQPAPPRTATALVGRPAPGEPARASTTPKPTPTSVTTMRTETQTEPVAFERTTVEDASMAQGETRVSTVGVPGERLKVFAVTLVDGIETARTLTSETVTRAPVAEVTSVGTFVAPQTFAEPPAQEQPAASEGCDPNYAEACVPIASDVDCAGGRGNGPAYFDGVARVVGTDIYRLDADGDGLACEPY